MRIDQLLVQRGLASTRSQAQRLIAAGVRCRGTGDWRRGAKNGDEVDADAHIELLDDAEVGKIAAEGLKKTLLMFDAFHDVKEKADPRFA